MELLQPNIDTTVKCYWVCSTVKVSLWMRLFITLIHLRLTLFQTFVEQPKTLCHASGSSVKLGFSAFSFSSSDNSNQTGFVCFLFEQAEPFFKDPKRFPDMADPHLNKQFPERSLNQAVAVAAMCLQEEPSARPLMSDVVTTLSFLSQDTEDPGKSGGSVSSRSNAASNSVPGGSESSDISVISSTESSPESGFGISGRNNSNELQISSTLKQNGSSSGSKKINKSFSLKSKSSRESFDSFKDTATSTSSGNSEDSSSEATLLDP